jgi:hypothetical protein
MTELEFINLNPASLATTGTANLLISSSVSGSDNIPESPYTITAMTIPNTSLNEVEVNKTVREASSIKFNFASGIIEAVISARQKKSGYYFLRFNPIVVTNLPSSIGFISGNRVYREFVSSFIFEPFFTAPFFNNDYNPVIGNYDLNKLNAVAQVVDRNSGQSNPSNILSLISGSSKVAELQNCSYTKAGIINSKYVGTKLNSGSIVGDDPALGLKEFQGSVHSIDATNSSIIDIQLSDRDVQDIYFTANLSGSHPTKKLADFPEINAYIYSEEGNRFVRSVNSKLFSVDKGKVYSTDEFGKVISIQ